MSNISHPAIKVGCYQLAGVVHRWAGHLRKRLAKARPVRVPSVCLRQHESRSVTSFQGCSITCLAGCLWLTHDGDCRDIVLESGQSHVADRDSRLIIHALTRSTFRLGARPAAAPDHAG